MVTSKNFVMGVVVGVVVVYAYHHFVGLPTKARS